MPLPERLLRAGLDALERGEEISLRAVAREAGVSAMAPYRHFEDKSALLAGIAMLGFQKLRAKLIEADDKQTDREALVAQGQAYIAFARTHPALFRLMFSNHHGGPPPVGDNAYGVMVRRVQKLVPKNSEAAVLACWSGVHGMATLALDGGLPTVATPVETHALRLIVGGLAGPDPR
jgi:AcrR family transcriptional regulator